MGVYEILSKYDLHGMVSSGAISSLFTLGFWGAIFTYLQSKFEDKFRKKRK